MHASSAKFTIGPSPIPTRSPSCTCLDTSATAAARHAAVNPSASPAASSSSPALARGRRERRRRPLRWHRGVTTTWLLKPRVFIPFVVIIVRDEDEDDAGAGDAAPRATTRAAAGEAHVNDMVCACVRACRRQQQVRKCMTYRWKGGREQIYKRLEVETRDWIGAHSWTTG